MKTANEIIDESIPHDRVNAYGYVKKCMIKYAQQACKEQRKICAKVAGHGHEIINANEPELK